MTGAEGLFVGGMVLSSLFLCLIGFILWIVAIIHTIKADVTDGEKIGWVLFLCILPFIAVIVWLFVGPRKPKDNATGGQLAA